MSWKFWKKKPKFNTALPITHGANYLGVPADPVILYLPTFGQVVILERAPARDFIPFADIYTEDRRLFDLTDLDVVPAAYYYRDEGRGGYVRD